MPPVTDARSRLSARAAPAIVSAATAAIGLAVLLGATTGCLSGRFDRADPPPAANASTTQVIDRIASLRQARQLPPPTLVPDLRSFALREIVAVGRGDASLATAAHSVALRTVQSLGRHTWAYATDCADLAELHLPPSTLEVRDLLMNAAAVTGHDGRTYILIVVTEPGTSSIRADQMGGGAGGTNPSIESYVHPAAAPGRCGERWPASQRTSN